MFDSIDSPLVNGLLLLRTRSGSMILIKADFTKCMDATNDFNSCSYYLEALSESLFRTSPHIRPFPPPTHIVSRWYG